MPMTSDKRVSVSKLSAPTSPALYLGKVEVAGQPRSARCSVTLNCQADAMLKNVRIAGPDRRRRTSGSGRTAGTSVRLAAERRAARDSIYGYNTTLMDSGGRAAGV